VQPRDTNWYEIEEFFVVDKREYIRYYDYDEIDEDTWYLITGS